MEYFVRILVTADIELFSRTLSLHYHYCCHSHFHSHFSLGAQVRYYEIFSASLKVRLDKMFSRITRVDVKEILTLIDWLGDYRVQIEEYGLGEMPSHAGFVDFARELLEEYKHRIKNQVLHGLHPLSNSLWPLPSLHPSWRRPRSTLTLPITQ